MDQSGSLDLGWHGVKLLRGFKPGFPAPAEPDLQKRTMPFPTQVVVSGQVAPRGAWGISVPSKPLESRFFPPRRSCILLFLRRWGSADDADCSLAGGKSSGRTPPVGLHGHYLRKGAYADRFVNKTLINTPVDTASTAGKHRSEVRGQGGTPVRNQVQKIRI